ncbi:hypothetical protein BH10PSE14_BH10PSE14_04170 [soil metagenome]
MSAAEDSAAIARQTRQLLKGAGATLGGRVRGPDWSDDRKQRVPRRNSFEVTDPRANPWSKIGDGSVGHGLAHREALLETAEELHQKAWRDHPLAEIRDARARQLALQAELDAHLAAGAAPIGRPALVRQELDKLKVFLEAAAARLRRIDVTILKAIIRRVDFATGKLFPAIETIAADAACHRNSVVGSLRRLKIHGLIDWVRRTVRTGNDGEFGPQLEQTSNAYYFDHRRRMATATWQRFWQRMVAKLRRLGSVPPGVAPGAPTGAEISDPELRATLAGLGALVTNAST